MCMVSIPKKEKLRLRWRKMKVSFEKRLRCHADLFLEMRLTVTSRRVISVLSIRFIKDRP